MYPPDGREWAIERGIEQPPEGYCPSTNIVADITQPLDGSTVRGTMTLQGSAVAANFSHYQIELGQGTNPQTFAIIQEPTSRLVERGTLGTFDTTQIENGPYTLRLMVFDQSRGAVEARIRVLVDNPIPTPTPTPTATEIIIIPTDTPTSIPTETPTLIPSDTPTMELPTLTPIPLPTELPTENPTTIATSTPVPGPSPSLTPVPQSPTPSIPTSTPTPPLQTPTFTPTPAP